MKPPTFFYIVPLCVYIAVAIDHENSDRISLDRLKRLPIDDEEMQNVRLDHSGNIFADLRRSPDTRNDHQQNNERQRNKQKDKNKKAKEDSKNNQQAKQKPKDKLDKKDKKDKKEDSKNNQQAKQKPKDKLDKKDKKDKDKNKKPSQIKPNKNKPNQNKPDNKAIRVRKKCQTPLNTYRTCYERVIDPSNDVEDEQDFVLRNPFSQPFIDRDEWMVTDTMHLELFQKAYQKEDELDCENTLALEELTLEYLKENVGYAGTFAPICVLISESVIKNEVANDGSGQMEEMQSIALKLHIVFAFKRQFVQEIEDSKQLNGLRQLKRSNLTCNRGNFGLCCASKAFNSRGAKSSVTCEEGCGSIKCTQKRKGSLFTSGLYKKEFYHVVSSRTDLVPKETRGILGASRTEDVASCSVNRFIEDVLGIPSLTCKKYRDNDCISNEDLLLSETDLSCDSGGIFDCSKYSEWHEYNDMLEDCEPICPNDNNVCTTDGWNDELKSCFTPVKCSDGAECDPMIGCPSCNDNNKCTVESWDYEHHTCIFNAVDCSSFSKYHQCDPIDGNCKPKCSDDGDACTIDKWNKEINSCHTPIVCSDGAMCDYVAGCPSCDDDDKCTIDTWDYKRHECVFTPVDCSSYSEFHVCDPSDGKCKPDCKSDGNACTVDLWNKEINSCHTAVRQCPLGEKCDVVTGCSCEDNNFCTIDVWDAKASTCHNTLVSCSENESCDPFDGTCHEDEMLIPCISVIDEDSYQDNRAKWRIFRTLYPERPFCLVIPYSDELDGMGIPPQAINDPKFQVYYVVRDEGDLPPDDWFTLCGLDKMTLSNTVRYIGMFLDQSGSMSKATVQNSYDKFLQMVADAGLTIRDGDYNNDEDWILPFIKDFLP